jgi:hypothetical protein
MLRIFLSVLALVFLIRNTWGTQRNIALSSSHVALPSNGMEALVEMGIFSPSSFECPRRNFSHIQSKEGLEPFDHIFIFMMENSGNEVIIGNKNMSFINLLIEYFGFAAEYYGITHTSLPNYIALTSGNNWWSYNDSTEQVFDHTCIADKLEEKGLGWKNYAQSIPYAGYKGSSTYPPNSSFLWFQDHVPFLFYPQIFSNPVRAANIQPLEELEKDLYSCNVPEYVFISPDACHDMHGGSDLCPSVSLYPNNPEKLAYCLNTKNTSEDCVNINNLWKAADDFLREWIPKIVNSPSWTGNSVIVVTWDESNFNEKLDVFIQGGPDTPYVSSTFFTFDGHSFLIDGFYGGGQVPLIVISKKKPYHIVTRTKYNHYSLLKSIEAAYGLDYLGYTSDDRQIKVMHEFFG